MDETQMKAIWEQILSKVQESLSESVCNKWLRPVRPIALTDQTLTIGTPNDFYKEWINDRYIPFLEDATLDATGNRLHIIIQSLNLPLPQEKAPKKSAKNDIVKEGAPIQDSLINDETPSIETTNLHQFHDVPEQIAPGDPSTLNPRYTFDTFVTGKSNQLAHAAALAVAASPGNAYNPFFMYGGVGLGKTHLMHAIGHQILRNNPDKRVLYVSSEKFTNELINSIRDNDPEMFRQKYRTVDVLLVDDIQFLAGKTGTQEEFFHTFNTLRDADKQIILSSDRPPREVKELEERLRSRFEWGLITDVQPPDLETRIAILKKKAQIDHLNVPNDVMVYIASRIDSNIRELEGALTRAVAYASLTQQPVTTEVVAEALKNIFSDNKHKKITMEVIQEIIADYFHVKIDELHSKKRTREIAFPRQIAMYLCRELADTSLPQIGNFFGGRDHTTVLHACDKIKAEKESNKQLGKTITELTERIQQM